MLARTVGLECSLLGWLEHSERASQDTVLYTQICLCMDLVGRAGGATNPTILDEWASPELKTLTAPTPTSARSQTGRNGANDEAEGTFLNSRVRGIGSRGSPPSKSL